jgi:hypothetical protein
LGCLIWLGTNGNFGSPRYRFLEEIMGILDLSIYKDYQNISSDTNDTKIIKTIGAVNDFITSYCNRTFVDYFATDKTELFDITESEYYPEEFPLVSVTSVKYSSAEDGVFDTTLTEYTDYIIDIKNSRLVANGSYFSTALMPVNSGEIVYKAGLENYPEDIIQSAVLLTEYYMEESYTPRKSLAGASVDSVIQPDLTARLPQHIRRVLEHHRAFVI